VSTIAKLRTFFGINPSEDPDYEEDGYEDDGQDYRSSYSPEHSHTRGDREVKSQNQSEVGMGSTMSNTNNVVGMPMPGAWKSWGTVSEVMVIEPDAFEKMPQVVQALRERKSVVLNLTMMDPEQAQRAVDFVAGATFTIDGHQERIGESIFLFTPSCVQVSTQSGVVHEVSQQQQHRPPAPSWTGDAVVSRFAQ